MLNFQSKIEILENYLSDINDDSSCSYKTDILFYFDELDKNNIKLKFLEKLNSELEIHKWLDDLISRIFLKYNEDEEQLSDFIYYSIFQKNS